MWRGKKQPPETPFLVDPPFDEQRPGGHFCELDGMCAALNSGACSATFVREMPATTLKKYYKESSTFPSYEEKCRLSRKVLGSDSDEKLTLIDRWFSERRMDDFVKMEERRQRKANADQLESDELRKLAEQMLQLARQPPASIAAISALPGSREDYAALLSDARVDLNVLSRKRDELMERTVEHREFIIGALGLDRDAVYSVLQSEENVDPFEQAPCMSCGEKDFDTDNPILFCDGNHNKLTAPYALRRSRSCAS